MNNKGKILLVDDELNTLKVLSAILKKYGYDVHTSRTAEEAMDKVANLSFNSIIADYKLPGMNGVEFLDVIKEKGYDTPVIMLTAYGTIEKAVDAMRKGAFNYLTKPVNPDKLLTITREAVEKHQLVLENKALKSQLKERYSFRNIISKSHAMRYIFNLIETVARSNTNVLVAGESGTGKELVAKAIHFESSRANNPFIPIDCASLSGELFESELFGHENGSLTGAYEKKKGKFDLADGGTLFLDEIGDMSLSAQSRMLCVIEAQEFQRVGGSKIIKVDIRIIAATNRDLESEVKKGNFREDLFFRLHVVTLHIPPLRERKEDIPILVNHFLYKFNTLNNKAISFLDGEVMKAFMEYEWPGNVRELENAIERAVVLCLTDTITMKYLPRVIREIYVPDSRGNGEFNLIEVEKRLLLRALEKTSWNQTKTAEVLGISRKQLRTKMKHHCLLPDEKGTKQS